MQKILITGFNGFVSGHYINYLENHEIKTEILGVDISVPETDYSSLKNLLVNFVQLDLLDAGRLENLINGFNPDFILHLASYSSVGYSWKNPSLSFKNNMNIFLNLLEAARAVCPGCRILSIGSSEEYGNIINSRDPLKEDHPLEPVSPYAVARVSQEQLSKVYCTGYGLDLVMTRSFNHIGPGQKDMFVISSFARQLVEINKGIKKEKKLVTGDISVIRDFIDVRDVVDAYYRLFSSGKRGEVYNICSGEGVSLHEALDIMCGILNVKVELETDPELIRPNDNKIIIGSCEKLIHTTGWEKSISLRQSLIDIIKYWEDIL